MLIIILCFKLLFQIYIALTEQRTITKTRKLLTSVLLFHLFELLHKIFPIHYQLEHSLQRHLKERIYQCTNYKRKEKCDK